MTSLRNKRWLRWGGRALAVFTASWWLACGVDGDVAMTMTCPEGETCTDSLVGARFTGTSPSDGVNQRLDTAVGGRQSFSVAAPLLSGASLPSWHAVSDDPSVFEVEDQGSGSVTLRGVGSGSAYLRVLDVDENLIDRIRLGAEPVQRAELRGQASFLAGSVWDGPWVFMAGTEQSVTVALLDADGGRLVDQDATIPADDAVTPTRWDAATVVFPSAGGSFRMFIDTGSGARLTVDAALVERIDRVQRVELFSGESDAPIEVIAEGSGALACVIPTLGSAAVAGAPLTAEGPAALTTEIDQYGSLTCASITSDQPGDYTVVISGPGATLSLPVTVLAGS